MKLKNYYSIKKLSIFLILVCFFEKQVFANQAYFDLSDQKIEIQTNFKGKEVIIFGLTEQGFDTLLTIKGPEEYKKIQKKERIFGLWINNDKIIYRNLPSIYFVAASAPINQILDQESIENNELYFQPMLLKLMTQRNFNFSDENNEKLWSKNLISIKQKSNFYKEYEIKIVDDKLFQTRVFFPSNTMPGNYQINIYQIKNKEIISKKNKSISIIKSGIGNELFNLAHNYPKTYGIMCIIFAIFSGLLAAIIFRRL